MRICKTPGCNNLAAKHRTNCRTCENRLYKKRHPIKYAFFTLRNNAKRRGKEFSLTFEQFKEFAVKTDYLNGRGRTKEGFHIDRLKEDEGYHIDNLQVLTNSENVKKYIVWNGRVNGRDTFKTVKAEEYVHDDIEF